MEDIAAERHFVQRGFARGIRQGEIRDDGVLRRNHIHGSESHRFVGQRVHDRSLDLRQALCQDIVIDNDHLCFE